MKNKFINLIYFIIINLILISVSFSAEVFNFDVTEVEILENGNKFIGKKGGKATSADGVTIKAINFNYNKRNNILIATGNVEVKDEINKTVIYSQKITYFKNEELILTDGKSKAIDNALVIEANKFRFEKNVNLINANGKVKIEDGIENYIIYAQDITYLKNEEKIFTTGKTNAIFNSTYDFMSSDVTVDRLKKKINSSQTSTIDDGNSNLYKLSSFVYFYDRKFLKGEDVEVVSNYKKEKSDDFYFKNAFIDFKNNSFTSKDTEILLHKGIFDKERDSEDKTDTFSNQNDPRISGVSSRGNKKKIVLNKAIFTSCKKNDSCPPWSIKADKIIHDRQKKEISYKDAILNVYDVPVFYFPKFFHPDPTVDRRSGLLQPRLNNSNILGSSFNLPYFHVISENKDITFKPTVFDSNIYMLQNEYRQENENSSFIADFNYTKGYQSSVTGDGNRNSISHLFAKYDLDLGLKNFVSSKFNFFIEKVNNDTYLKVFENVLLVNEKFEEDLKDKNNLNSGLELTLDHENYNFTTGLKAYENLQKVNSDRYQYVFPYYDFNKTLFSNSKGSIKFNTSGRNSLSDTNNLRTTIFNTLDYTSSDIYSKSGFLNNFGIYFKNLNMTGKNDLKYKSNLQSELLNIYEINSSMPLLKMDKDYNNYITPKISFRINPSDMKNNSTTNRLITTDNIFDINRLGLNDSYESGKSFTVGIDFKKENKIEIEKYLEFKLAAVVRDTKEEKIPTSSSINRSTSNLFGSIENSFSDFLSLNYDFAIDNDFNKFEHNSIEAEFTVNNFVTKFNFLEKNGEMGDINTIENTTKYSFDESNSLVFKTRRNRKISLTEYYDLIYEYQNDCLTAGIKYRKTYYQDRDLRPKEDLFFTITLFPLTTLDQKIDESAWRGDNAIQNLFK